MTQGQLAKLAERYVEQVEDEIEVVQDERDMWAGGMLFTIAILMLERDLPKKALKEINKALKLSPDEPDYYHTKAEILLDLEKPKEALRCINRCIELEDEEYDEEGEPRNPSSLMLKADVYHDLGKYKIAIDCDLKAIQLFKKQKIINDPRKETLAVAFYDIGHHYLHLKKYGQSLKWLQKAEKQKPHEDMGDVYFDKADALLNLKRYHEATVTVRKALDYDYEDGENWLMYAYCLVMDKGQSFDVLRALNFAVLLLPYPDLSHRIWNNKINTITRYLKNADEDKMVKDVIKVKKAFQELKVTSRKGSLKK
jgi:tetratricopeptide (TPR) repeat protein